MNKEILPLDKMLSDTVYNVFEGLVMDANEKSGLCVSKPKRPSFLERASLFGERIVIVAAKKTLSVLKSYYDFAKLLKENF